jgi:hypothetical protein
MTLELTKPLTEISTGNVYGGKVGPVRKADNLTAFFGRLSRKCWSHDVSHSHVGLHALLQE